jgi:transposase, IS30 family
METMGRKYSTTERAGRHHKHLTQAQRDTLDHLARRGGRSRREMAAILGVSVWTVRRELRRGAVVNIDSELRERVVYSAEKGRQEATLAASNKGPRPKLTTGMRAVLVPMLKEGRKSPGDALATLRDRGVTGLPCDKTVYNAIHAGELGVLMVELPYRSHKAPKGKRLKRKAFTGRGNRSIEERPAHVESREEFGHYELDTIVGRRGTREVLLSVTERKTRMQSLVRLRRRSQRSVLSALRALARAGKLPGFRSATCDNGCEFLDQKALERALRGCVYYAHPYSAFERGSNENANRIVRRFLPKGTDFGKLSRAEVAAVEALVNAIHRDVLVGLTASQALERELRPPQAA